MIDVNLKGVLYGIAAGRAPKQRPESGDNIKI
jgi:hypothetical protein